MLPLVLDWIDWPAVMVLIGISATWAEAWWRNQVAQREEDRWRSRLEGLEEEVLRVRNRVIQTELLETRLRRTEALVDELRRS